MLPAKVTVPSQPAMSWLARSLANSLLSPDSGEAPSPSHASPADGDPTHGVKEDISELTDAFARRFHGLASFLAPPPHADPHSHAADLRDRLSAGLARLPGRPAIADLAKIASSLLPTASPEEDDAAAGVTEEVIVFVKDAAMRPELWLDFPLLPDDDESDEFDMSDAQQDHALAVESVAPELADLRIELCPSHMSESCFWKIYFVLLHPNLKREDAEILSSPQIMEAREKLSHNLQYQTKLQRDADKEAGSFSNVDDTAPSPVELVDTLKDIDDSERATPLSNVDYGTPQPINLEIVSKDSVVDAVAVSLDNLSCSVPVQLMPISEGSNNEVPISRMEESTGAFSTADAVTEMQRMQMAEITLAMKSTTEDDPQKQSPVDLSEESRIVIQNEDDDGDEWLEEETGGLGSTSVPIGDDEDVSFSDLEEEDETK